MEIPNRNPTCLFAPTRFRIRHVGWDQVVFLAVIVPTILTMNSGTTKDRVTDTDSIVIATIAIEIAVTGTIAILIKPEEVAQRGEVEVGLEEA